jgi:cation transport ATPase
MISGNTEGTPITQLRQDLVQNDAESHYSVESIKTSSEIREIVDDINKNNYNNKKSNLLDFNKDDKSTDSSDSERSYRKDKKKKRSKGKKCKQNLLEDSIYDGVLLLIIFMLMSQHFVKTFIGNYIKIINVNKNGVVPFFGVLTYGVIFVLVFLSSRLLIHKISQI